MTQSKIDIVRQLDDYFCQYDCFYIFDVTGFSANDSNLLRDMCYDNNVVFKIAKNSLIMKALLNIINRQPSCEQFKSITLRSMSGIMFVKEEYNMPAKIMSDFIAKSNNNVKLKYACLESDLFIGEDKLSMLKNMKSKKEIIGEIVSMLKTPIILTNSAITYQGNMFLDIIRSLEKRNVNI